MLLHLQELPLGYSISYLAYLSIHTVASSSCFYDYHTILQGHMGLLKSRHVFRAPVLTLEVKGLLECCHY